MSGAGQGPEVLLAAQSLRCGRDGRTVVPALDVTLQRGQLWALIGDNGSGKSTLLATLMGLLAAAGGSRIVRSGTRLAYVGPLQRQSDEAPLRVTDLLTTGALRGLGSLWPWRQQLSATARRRLLVDFDLVALAERPYASLSEGQKQRVALARAFASAPELLFLDEPTSAMDANQAARALQLLRRRASADGTCVVMVGHQLAPLLAVADAVVWLHGPDRAPDVGSTATLGAAALAAAVGLPAGGLPWTQAAATQTAKQDPGRGQARGRGRGRGRGQQQEQAEPQPQPQFSRPVAPPAAYADRNDRDVRSLV